MIYLTSNTYMEIAHHLCIQLGLPLSTVRVFQGTSQEQMEEMIAEDKAAGKLPTLCIANVHSCLYQVLYWTSGHIFTLRKAKRIEHFLWKKLYIGMR